MKILVVSNNYPSNLNPEIGVFVYKFVQQLSKNHKVHVITPQKKAFFNRNPIKYNYGVESAVVVRPTYWSFSNKGFLSLNTYHFGAYSQRKAIQKVFKNISSNKFDFIYCHFISNALITLEALSEFNIPIFVGVGEYFNIDKIKSFYSSKKYFSLLKSISGFIAVSQLIKNKLLSFDVDSKLIELAPNGVDLMQYRRNRTKSYYRKKLGLRENATIAIFVGRFIENKGPIRVLKAVELLENEVDGIFIGQGNQQFESDKILIKGKFSHDMVIQFLLASDVFVLPTLHEGSSNAIIEAMACGLPIVSSNIPEIRSQCDSSFSILVDPMDIYAISKAINSILSDSDMNKSMSDAALKHSEKFDIGIRTKKIMAFINNRLNST